MSSHSFFHLTPPPPDHVCMTPRERAYLEHEDFLDAMTPEELATFRQQSVALANALQRALHAYTEEHQEVSYGVIFDALGFLQAVIDTEMREDPEPEDCDA